MYIEPAEVKTILAGITSDDDDDYQGTAAELNNTIIEMHIQEAEAQIHAALSSKYTVPFSPDVPELIKAITRNFAAYFADLTYRKTKAFDNNNYPSIRRYNWALDQLDKLRRGQISIDFDAGTGAEIYHVYDGPLFTQEHFLGYKVHYDGRYEVHDLWDLL